MLGSPYWVLFSVALAWESGLATLGPERLRGACRPPLRLAASLCFQWLRGDIQGQAGSGPTGSAGFGA